MKDIARFPDKWGDRFHKSLTTGLSIALALTLALTSASCDNDSKSSKDRTTVDQRAPSYNISEICSADAARKKKEIGRPPPYNTMTSRMPYIDEAGGYADAYLGATYLKAPLGYLHSIDGGALPKDGGRSIVFEALLPDFKPYVKGNPPAPPRADGRPVNVTIFARCTGAGMSPEAAAKQRKLTEEDHIGHRRKWQIAEGIRVPGFVPIPELNLRAWPARPEEKPYKSATYFALDPKLTYPLGDVFYFACSGDQQSATRQSCIGNFFILPNVAVKFNFPYQWLDHWQEVYAFVLELMTTSIQE